MFHEGRDWGSGSAARRGRAEATARASGAERGERVRARSGSEKGFREVRRVPQVGLSAAVVPDLGKAARGGIARLPVRHDSDKGEKAERQEEH